ncbi:hypothetical protein PGT21_006208 [Puccinia graminis f. sp. tritici]|uniref:Uncharacterized protein n=1 Tax=Puccinia graminis f. sp. tritici TaxID=56615 RepID=A0A5B0QSN3_PUCGR|nr:hypothetical protein PGT21_006208 [Puccinia graminis f. sp. tritici]
MVYHQASHNTYLKKFIKDLTGDLLLAFGSLSVAVDNQLNSVHESIGKDTTKNSKANFSVLKTLTQ